MASSPNISLVLLRIRSVASCNPLCTFCREATPQAPEHSPLQRVFSNGSRFLPHHLLPHSKARSLPKTIQPRSELDFIQIQRYKIHWKDLFGSEELSSSRCYLAPHFFLL